MADDQYGFTLVSTSFYSPHPPMASENHSSNNACFFSLGSLPMSLCPCNVQHAKLDTITLRRGTAPTQQEECGSLSAFSCCAPVNTAHHHHACFEIAMWSWLLLSAQLQAQWVLFPYCMATSHCCSLRGACFSSILL